MNGKILSIYTAEKGKHPEQHSRVYVEKHKGIVGDRYHKGEGTFSEQLKGNRKSEITFISVEEVDRFNKLRDINLEYGVFRRNVITHGIDLNSLIGKEFEISSIRFKGIETCEPCAHLAKTVHPEVLPHLVKRAGLRAAILTSGEIKEGDEIIITSSTE